MRIRGRRSSEDAGVRDNLVPRFALVTAIGVAVAALLILFIVRTADTRQAERHAVERAQFAAESVIVPGLRPQDVRVRVAGVRRAQIDRLLETRILRDGITGVRLVNALGRITYATNHRLIGRPIGAPGRIREAFGGKVVGTVGTVAGGSSRALVTYVPVVVGGKARIPGVVVVQQDYGMIADDARQALLPIVGALGLVLGGLFLFLVPALSVVSSRLRRHAREIAHRGTHDGLTGLPNRAGFLAALHPLLQSDTGVVAVLTVDLDRFKEINNGLGRESGDQVIVTVAKQLKRLQAAGRPVGRIGSDQFAIAARVRTIEEARTLADVARERVERPFTVFDVPLQVSSTVGIAVSTRHGSDAEVLLQRSEVAIDLAREKRLPADLYDADRDTNDASRVRLMAELRDAIDSRQLTVVFQPIVSFATAEVESVEALVRWNHPTMGPLPPGSFIPLAEHTELIGPLTRLVLDRALEACAQWYRAGADISVSVNVSMIDLDDDTFTAMIGDRLEQYDLPPRLLTLELTETVAMTDSERIRSVLEGLRRLGVRISIDDFGTGYSSLSYLQRLPAQAIKIDRMFVAAMHADPSAATIVRSTVELARNLGLTIVAEGIETEEQWDSLKELGCDFGQGYLIGREVTADAIAGSVTEAPPSAGVAAA